MSLSCGVTERRRGRVGGDALMPNLFSNMLGVGENDVDEKLKYVGSFGLHTEIFRPIHASR